MTKLATFPALMAAGKHLVTQANDCDVASFSTTNFPF